MPWAFGRYTAVFALYSGRLGAMCTGTATGRSILT